MWRTSVRYTAGMAVREAALSGLRARPVTLSVEQVLAVAPPLESLLPERGLRRGTTLSVAGPGALSLVLAFLAVPTSTGSWCAVTGLPELAPVAAAGMGVQIDRLALIPSPGRAWPSVVAALADAFAIVVMRVPPSVRPGDARRLAARLRERGAVLILAPSSRTDKPVAPWPEPPVVRLSVATLGWQGLGEGHGHLVSRQVEVTVEGRGRASRPRRVGLLLPGADGKVQALPLAGSDRPEVHQRWARIAAAG